MQMGDTLEVFDGKGNLYTASIQLITKREVQAIILETTHFPKSSYQIHLAIAPTKNISRLEWCIEKACELGIESITPLLCQHSERKIIKADRLEKIILSATKQSQKVHLPTLLPLKTVKEYLGIDKKGAKFICHCAYATNPHIATLYKKDDKVIQIMIGPEGDFDSKEIELATKAGFLSAGLGKERLRTETAGVYACSVIHTLQSLA